VRPDRTLLVATLLAAGAGAGTGYLAAVAACGPLAEALALRPPVVVLALAGGLESLPPEGWAAQLRAHSESAARLARAGYLVLDAQAVVAAPADLYLAGPGRSEGKHGAARGRSSSGGVPDPSADARAQARREPDEARSGIGPNPSNGFRARPGQGPGAAHP